MTTLPALAGAMAGAQIGVTAISLLKEGCFSLSNLMAEIDGTALLLRSH